jgi:hypothetical protein
MIHDAVLDINREHNPTEPRPNMPITMTFHQYLVATAAIWLATTLTLSNVSGFQAAPAFAPKRARAQSALYSSAGGGAPPPPPSDNNKGEGNSWDDFLDPTKQESESMRKAREYVSENSLPISFDHVDDEDDDEVDDDDDDDDDDDVGDIDVDGDSIPKDLNSSALVGQPKGGDLLRGGPSKDALKNNPYMAVVSKLSPSELISKFTGTAHPRVQAAVKTTILGLIGGLPKLAFDTTTITTGQRLASLMFQLQMTGYMFKNADYRLSLAQSLGVPPSSLILTGKDDEDDDDEENNIMNGKVGGKLRIRYRTKAKDSEETSDDDDDDNAASPDGLELEVDAASYMSELRQEVSQLRDDLMTTRQEKEEALRKDLLLYIRTLPEQELRSLTNTMSPDVLVAMKGLVQAVMSGIGEGEIGPETVTEQSGEAMAQLCMWQLAIGYNLRTLEVREEMKKSLIAGGIDATSEEGAFE